jgi:hypothetical protein
MIRILNNDDPEVSRTTVTRRVVGEAYVQGIMNGEWIDKMNESGPLPWKELHIC